MFLTNPLHYVFGRPFVKQFALCYRTIVPSVTLVYCGQMVGCIKIPLGTEVGLGPGHILLDGDPTPPKKGNSPQFSAHVCCGQMAGWTKMPLGKEEAKLSEGTQLPKKGYVSPPLFGPCLLLPNDWMDEDAMWYGGRPRPRRHCVRWRSIQLPQQKGAQQPPLFSPCLLWPNGRPCQQLLSCCVTDFRNTGHLSSRTVMCKTVHAERV